MDTDGDFIAAWQSQNQDLDGYGVYVQRYSSSPLTNTVPSLAESTSTASPVRVADFRLVGGSAGTVTLSGADATLFEVSGNSLFLKAGTALDFETRTSYAVTVDIDYAAVSGTPDAATNFLLNVTDVGEFTVTESSGTTSVSEHGAAVQKSDTFTVVLDAAPTSNVVFNVTSGDTTEATVNVTTLTFTTANWNVAQTVTVSGVFDNIADGNQPSVITLTVNDALSDDLYDAALDQTVTATVNDVANRPVVTGPSTGEQSAFPTFTWNDVAGETNYSLWLINKGTGTLVFSKDDIAADATSYALTAGDVPGGLTSGDYRFWINSISANGYSQSGPPTDFAVGAAAVVPAAPVVTGTSGAANPPTINWNVVSGATTYGVYLINLDTNTLITSQTGIVSNNFTPAVLVDGRYRIWVNATNVAGSSSWSTPFDFSIGTAPTAPPTTPTGLSVSNANTSTPTVTWTAQAAGTKYAIWFVNLDTGTLISGETNLTTASYTPASALTNGHYRIWVRAYNSIGSSGWSSPFDFTVAA
jgi:hypothetical protein